MVFKLNFLAAAIAVLATTQVQAKPVELDQLIERYIALYNQANDSKDEGLSEVYDEYFEILKDLRALNPLGAPCPGKTLIEESTLYILTGLYNDEHTIPFVDVSATYASVLNLINTIETYKIQWIESIKKDPHFTPPPQFLYSPTGQPHPVKVLLDRDTETYDYNIYLDLGRQLKLSETGNYKNVYHVLQYESWHPVALLEKKTQAGPYIPLKEIHRGFEAEKKVSRYLRLLSPQERVGLVRVLAVTENGILVDKYDANFEDLYNRLRGQGEPLNLTDDQKVALFRRPAQGMVTLHRHNLLHSDLHFGNLLVNYNRPEGPELAITDFGVTTDVEQALGEHGSRALSPGVVPAGHFQFMPPERSQTIFGSQAYQKETLLKSDVFSLSLDLAMIARPELVEWMEKCQDPASFESCRNQYFETLHTQNERGIYTDELSRFLIWSLNPDPNLRPNAAQWSAALNLYLVKSHPDTTLAQRKEDQAKLNEKYIKKQTSVTVRPILKK